MHEETGNVYDELDNIRELCSKLIKSFRQLSEITHGVIGKHFKIGNEYYMKIVYTNKSILRITFYNDNYRLSRSSGSTINLNEENHQIYNISYNNLTNINKKLPEGKKIYTIDDLKLLLEEVAISHL